MSKISNVYYTEIDVEKRNPKKASEYYFYLNLLGQTDELDNEYLRIEADQSTFRSKLIGSALQAKEIPSTPIMSSVIYGISSMKNSLVIVAEY